MERGFLKLVFIFISLLLVSCDVVEPEKVEGIINVSGTFKSQEEHIRLSGGIIEYKLHNDKSKGGYHKFKITDLPIRIYGDSIRAYVYSLEKVNVLFSINSGDADKIVEPGTYTFTDLDPKDADFPFHAALFNSFISRGTGSTISNKFAIGGTVVIDGSYPNFNINGEFIMEGNMTITFSAGGRFVTQENFHTFIITSM